MNTNIKYDAVTNTITLSKSFYEASMIYGSTEQEYLSEIQKKHPGMIITVKSHKTTYTSSTKGLTYEYMRKFIRHLDKKNIATFEEVIAHYEDFGYSSGKVYLCVKDWFLESYPRHNKIVIESTPNLVA